MTGAIINPLMLLSLGRCGTTLLMNYLSCQPEIVAFRAYPFETRVAQYYAHVAGVLSGPAVGNAGELHNTIIAGKPWVTGNPYPEQAGPEWHRNEFSPRLVSLSRDSIRHAYENESQRQGKAPKYFLEKSHVLTPAPRYLEKMFSGYREIYLVRDPRAIVASIITFNRKRGYDGFGIEASPVDEFTEGLCQTFREVRRRTKEDGSALIRYEDLVISPDEVLSNLLESIGIAPDGETVRNIIARVTDMSDIRDLHATTGNNRESLDSWKANLPSSYETAINSSIGELMKDFGYR